MYETLKINDRVWFCSLRNRKEYFHLVRLGLLLSFMSDEGPDFQWAVIPSSESTLFYSYGKEGNLGWQIMETIHAGDGKYGAVRPDILLAWDEMLRLANDIADVEMATFVAARNPEVIEKLRTYLDVYGSLDNAKPSFYEEIDFALSVVFGQHWQVWAKDEAVRKRIQEVFPQAEVVPWQP